MITERAKIIADLKAGHLKIEAKRRRRKHE